MCRSRREFYSQVTRHRVLSISTRMTWTYTHLERRQNNHNNHNHNNHNNHNNRRLSQEFPFFFVAPFTMDPSWQPVMSAAQRRKQRRLRSWWRHEQQSIAAALATFSHHSAPRSTTARARGGARDEVHGRAPDDAPPQEPGTEHFKLDDEDSVPELSGLRPDPVLDPGPPVVGERHCGVGYEDSSRRPRGRSWAGTSPSRRR